MKGTLLNTAAIVAGSGVGLALRRGLPAGIRETLLQGLALAVMLIGIQMGLRTQNIIIVIISMVAGGITGQTLKIDKSLERFGGWLSARFGDESGAFGQAFISASLIFCIGAMAVVGAIQDGLGGDAAILYAKSALDAIAAAVFASALGPGVALAAASVLLYQGTITLIAGWFGAILNDAVIREVTAVGGLLIVGLGVSMLGTKKVNTANLLPALPAAAVLAYFWPA